MPIAMLITGFLVEEVSEKEFQEYLKQKIFSPLRWMTRLRLRTLEILHKTGS